MQYNNPFLFEGLCTNQNCSQFASSFKLSRHLRCPECNGPCQLMQDIQPTIDTHYSSLYERYFGEKMTDILGRYKGLFLKTSTNIGHTPLLQNKSVSSWANL